MISPVPWTRHGYHLAPQFAMLKTKTKEAAPHYARRTHFIDAFIIPTSYRGDHHVFLTPPLPVSSKFALLVPASNLAGSDKARLLRSDILSRMPSMIMPPGKSLKGAIEEVVSHPTKISAAPSMLLQCAFDRSLSDFARRMARSGTSHGPYLPLLLVAITSAPRKHGTAPVRGTKCYFFTKPSMASDARLLGRPLLFRCRSLSRSRDRLALGDAPIAAVGRGMRLSPLASMPALDSVLPKRCSFLSSRYILAWSESGNGEGSDGMSAPFCRRTSAKGNGFRGRGLEGRGGAVTEEPEVALMLDV